MEIVSFDTSDAERHIIDEAQEVESVKTNVHIDDWRADGASISAEFTYVARYLGKESPLRIPEIANLTVRGRMVLSVTGQQLNEMVSFKTAQEAARGPFTALDNSNPNYARLTLPENYFMEMSRIADQGCKPSAASFLDSLMKMRQS
jgi:hypothetical protein